ncbi:MAG: type III pantothenate kinase [Planctomycetota bacterium]
MILAIDIGNTNTHLAFFSGPNKIIASESIPNTLLNKAFLSKVLEINGGNKIISKVKTVLVASTNPDVEPIIIEWAKKIFKIKPLKAGLDFDIPITNRTEAPDKVGKDRLLNALAARKIVSGNKPIIVISCGTAITFDVINNRGEFLGGAIAPGINMMAKALYQNCALLPWVKLPAKKPMVLGRNTQEAIISGVYFGGAGLVKNIVQELIKSLKIKPQSLSIILTGGDAELVSAQVGSALGEKSSLPYKSKVIPDLTLKGLVWAYLAKRT